MIRNLIDIRRQWLALGAAVVGLTGSVTVLGLYLPLALADLTDSQAAIGFGVGVEGLVALTIPLIIGRSSDRRGRRIPYMLAATPLILLGLLGAGLLDSYWPLVGAVVTYFVGYYAYYTAYQALYPDTIPPEEYGRAWSTLNVFQGFGVALALLGGGALLTLGIAAPFLGAGALILITTLVTVLFVSEGTEPKSTRQSVSTLRLLGQRIRTDRNLRWFLPAHFGWEFALAGIRAFVVLYILEGLGVTGKTLGLIGFLVIASYLIAALVSGNIVDRYDPRKYALGVIVLFVVSMFATGLITNLSWLQLIVPVGVFSGAAVLMLAYPILLHMTPSDRHGEYTGYYQANRGLALILGTVGTGGLIDLFGKHFPYTEGYQVLWLVTGTAVALTIPCFLMLTRKTPPAESAGRS